MNRFSLLKVKSVPASHPPRFPKLLVSLETGVILEMQDERSDVQHVGRNVFVTDTLGRKWIYERWMGWCWGQRTSVESRRNWRWRNSSKGVVGSTFLNMWPQWWRGKDDADTYQFCGAIVNVWLGNELLFSKSSNVLRFSGGSLHSWKSLS